MTADFLFLFFFVFQAIRVTAFLALCLMQGFSAFRLILLGVPEMPIMELVWFMVVGVVFEHVRARLEHFKSCGREMEVVP